MRVGRSWNGRRDVNISVRELVPVLIQRSSYFFLFFFIFNFFFCADFSSWNVACRCGAHFCYTCGRRWYTCACARRRLLPQYDALPGLPRRQGPQEDNDDDNNNNNEGTEAPQIMPIRRQRALSIAPASQRLPREPQEQQQPPTRRRDLSILPSPPRTASAPHQNPHQNIRRPMRTYADLRQEIMARRERHRHRRHPQGSTHSHDDWTSEGQAAAQQRQLETMSGRIRAEMDREDQRERRRAAMCQHETWVLREGQRCDACGASASDTGLNLYVCGRCGWLACDRCREGRGTRQVVPGRNTRP